MENKPRWWVGFLWAMVFAFAASVAGAIVVIQSVRRSTSSTAAIGCIWIPYFAAPYALVSAIWGLSIYGTWAAIRRQVHPALPIVTGLVAIALPVAAGTYLVQGLQFKDAVNAAHRINAQELETAFATSPLRHNRFFLGAIVQNEAASPDLLDRIASIADPELYEKMWSWWDVMGENGRGLAVMRLVVGNPKVTPATIEKLAASPLADDYLLGDILGNPKTPLPLLQKHANATNYLLKWGLAHNPNTPRDILERLARDPDEYTSRPAQENLRRR